MTLVSRRGLIALALGLTQRAADDFDRILAADSTHHLVRYHHARALIRLGRCREALTDLNVLIAIKPGDFAPYELRAEAHDAVGEPAKARLDRAQAQSLLSKNADVLNDRAWALVTGPRAA